MSIECLNRALKTEFKNQTPTKRLILILLANYCDDNNSCYPSYKHIAKLAGLKDPKHIANIVKEFEDLGLLRIEKRYNQDGGLTSNRYHLTLGSEEKYPDGPETPTPIVRSPDNTKEDKKEYKTNGDLTKDFELFWKNYPRKVNKYDAKVKYIKERREVDGTILLHAVLCFYQETKIEKKDKQFIPHCSTWLHQKRYLDYKDKTIIKEKKVTNLNKLAG